MLRVFKFLVPVFLVVVLFSCKQTATEIPINDFFKTPEKSSFRISPDGKYLSYIKPDKQKQNLYVVPVADVMNGIGNEKLAADLGAFARNYQWTFDNQIVFTQRNPLTAENKVCVMDMNSFKIRDLLAEKNVSVHISSPIRQTPDQITIEMNKRDSLYFDIYRLNIKTGELKTYYVNTDKVTDWYPDAEGKVLLAKQSDGVDETILYRANENAPFKAIIKNNFTESVRPIAFTVLKNAFYALSNVNRDKTALVTINPLTGKEEQVVFASDKADILDVPYSNNKHRLDFASWQEEKPKKHFLNGDAERMYKSLMKHPELSGNEVNVMSSDTSEGKFIVRASTDRDPGAVYLYQSKDDNLRLLVKNAAFPSDQLCEMRPVSYKATDGTTINGYLTLPQGDSTNLPVVVMPHDGLAVPFNRDTWRYNADVQFLANRGYAVFQPNFRGTYGYGKAFYKAGFKQAGGLVQDDITDGVNWLIANKIANPKKIAIYGTGFGGFSALYGLAFHQKLYSCAILRNPLINFFSYISNVPPFVQPSIQMMYEKVGDPIKDADQLRTISPAFYPEKIKMPLLIFPASVFDTHPNASQNELNQFVKNVKRHGVTVQYKPTDRSNLRNQTGRGNRDRIAMYTEIEKFLDSQMHIKH